MPQRPDHLGPLKLKLIHWETLKVLFPCSTQNKAHLVMFRIIWYSLAKQKKRIQNTFNQRSPYKKKIIRILKDLRTMNLSNPQRRKPKVTSSIHKRQVTAVCPIQRTYSCSGYLGSSDIGQSKRNTNTQVKNLTEYSCARSTPHLTLVPGFSACVMLWYAVVSDVAGLRDVS